MTNHPERPPAKREERPPPRRAITSHQSPMTNPTSPLSRLCWTVPIIMRVLYLRSMKLFSPPLALRERSRNGCSVCSLRIIVSPTYKAIPATSWRSSRTKNPSSHPKSILVNPESKITNHQSPIPLPFLLPAPENVVPPSCCTTLSRMA